MGRQAIINGIFGGVIGMAAATLITSGHPWLGLLTFVAFLSAIVNSMID